MRKLSVREIIIWVAVLFLVVPVMVLLLNDFSAIIDNLELVASALLILSLAVTSWRLKRRLKRRMERGLGRSVEDYELTSITAWMRIPDQAAQAGKEAEKYHFDD
jgi:hypothetical protein